MIHVVGRATLQTPYVVELDMTEEEYYAMPEEKIKELVNSKVDWEGVIRNAQVTDIELDDVQDAE